MENKTKQFKITAKEVNAIKAVLKSTDSLTKKYDKLGVTIGTNKSKLAKLVFKLNVRYMTVTNSKTWLYQFNKRVENWDDVTSDFADKLIAGLNAVDSKNFLQTAGALAMKFVDVENGLEIYDIDKLPASKKTWKNLGVDQKVLEEQIGSKKFNKLLTSNTTKDKTNKKIAKEVIKIQDLSIVELTNQIIIKTNKMGSVNWEQLGDNSQPTKKELINLLTATENLALKIRETRNTKLAKIS
tara:strand:- start:23282 stop:24004 length:723 start_codon:yes stop_codon:yes gene_type:complete